jgi:ankyrin repeat protein
VLLKRGANPSFVSNLGVSALVRAAGLGFEEAIALLVRYGADPDAHDSRGVTALGSAIALDQPGAVRALLRAGADPDGRSATREGSTTPRQLYAVPLLEAIMAKRAAMVPALLDAGADIDRIDRPPGMRPWAFHGRTPLVAAIALRDAATVSLLLERGATPDLFDPRSDLGALPIHAAARWADAQILGLLVKHGANPFARDRRGASALHYAASNRNQAALRELARLGLPINARTRDTGMTPAMIAAAMADVATLDLLVKLGADPRVRSNDGQTAASIAAAAGRAETLKYLQQYNPVMEAK